MQSRCCCLSSKLTCAIDFGHHRDAKYLCAAEQPPSGLCTATAGSMLGTHCCPTHIEPGRAGRCNSLALSVRRVGKKCDRTPGGLYEYCPVACGNCTVCEDHPLHTLYAKLTLRNRADALRERYLSLQECVRGSSMGQERCGVEAQRIERARLLRRIGGLLAKVDAGEDQDRKLLCLIRTRLDVSGVTAVVRSPTTIGGSVVHDLFGGSLRALSSGQGWRAWRPHDPLWPRPRPSTRCANSSKDLMRGGDGMLEEQPLCLAPAPDVISDAIRDKGRWHDCGKFVRMWERLNGLCDARASDGIMLEIGANIGACTVELLLRTNARVVAFEPSPTNLFYLTRNL